MISSTTYSCLALLPSLVTIALAFYTKEVLVALFAGIATGGITLFLQTGQFSSLNIVSTFIVPALSSQSYAIITLIYLWCVGGILGIWAKTGNAEYFAQQLGKRIARGRRSSLFLAWLLGVIFHQGGTISTILTGTTVKPVADHYKVSHEELSYVVDSTGSPIAALIPFNPWPLYISSLIVGTTPLFTTLEECYQYYIASILYNFYSIIAIISTLLFSLGLLPWVGSAMNQAINRSKKYKLLDGPQAHPLVSTQVIPHNIKNFQPNSYGFIIPIAILLSLSIFPFFAWQMGWIAYEYAMMTNEAFMLAMLSALIIAYMQGMPLRTIIEGLTYGCQEMTLGAIILGLAITLAQVAQEVHTADYLIAMISSNLPVVFLPGALTVLCMIVAFSTGTSFGTFAVVLPVAMPLAYSLNPDPIFTKICLGCVMGGTIFGDQCSPISDTTILSSLFTGCDLMDHVKTQLPLALVTAFLALMLSSLCALFLL